MRLVVKENKDKLETATFPSAAAPKQELKRLNDQLTASKKREKELEASEAKKMAELKANEDALKRELEELQALA